MQQWQQQQELEEDIHIHQQDVVNASYLFSIYCSIIKYFKTILEGQVIPQHFINAVRYNRVCVLNVINTTWVSIMP